MKRKKSFVIIVIACMVFLLGGFYVSNEIFPKAEPMSAPSADEVLSSYTSCNTINTNIRFSVNDLSVFLRSIENAKATRKQSMNDTPTTRPYYMIQLNTAEMQYRYFVYESGTAIYIEVPYEGIYTTTIETLDCVLKYYEEG